MTLFHLFQSTPCHTMPCHSTDLERHASGAHDFHSVPCPAKPSLRSQSTASPCHATPSTQLTASLPCFKLFILLACCQFVCQVHIFQLSYGVSPSYIFLVIHFVLLGVHICVLPLCHMPFMPFYLVSHSACTITANIHR